MPTKDMPIKDSLGTASGDSLGSMASIASRISTISAASTSSTDAGDAVLAHKNTKPFLTASVEAVLARKNVGQLLTAFLGMKSKNQSKLMKVYGEQTDLNQVQDLLVQHLEFLKKNHSKTKKEMFMSLHIGREIEINVETDRRASFLHTAIDKIKGTVRNPSNTALPDAHALLAGIQQLKEENAEISTRGKYQGRIGEVLKAAEAAVKRLQAEPMSGVAHGKKNR